jgi:uncharacterized membrane protein
MTLTKVVTLPGYWRANATTDTFINCKAAFSISLNASADALSRCIGSWMVKDNSSSDSVTKSTRTFNPNDQCKVGYGGPLCLVCLENYVMMGGSCVECSGGSSFAFAMIPMVVACVLLMLFVVVFLLYITRDKVQENLVRSKSMAQLKATKKVYRCVGQFKILISFLQIFSSMPNVLDSVPWPIEFMQVAIPLGIFNLDFLAVLSKNNCGLSVSFFDRFTIHMILPICCLLHILVACFIARLCRSKSKRKRSQINEATSKIVILVVLLLFPGLSTKVFQMWKCQRIDGIEQHLLVQDFSISCYEGEHVIYSLLAVTFLFVYVLGIPLIIFVLLWRNRKHFFDEKSPKHHWVKTALGGLFTQCEFCVCVLSVAFVHLLL